MAPTMAAPSIGEKVKDICEKVGVAATAVRGMLPGGDFQVTTREVHGGPVKLFKHLPPSVGEYLRGFMRESPKKRWIVYGGETYTYGEALVQAESFAAALHSTLGVRYGDRVCIAMRNLPEFLIAFIGILLAGCVAVPLNSLWKGNELKYAFEDSGASVVLVDPQRFESCLPYKEELGLKIVLCRATGSEPAGATISWEELLVQGRGAPAPDLKRVDGEDDSIIMYTSGSTGSPKGVCHTQRSLGTAIKLGHLSARLVPDPQGKALLAVPLFHVTALVPVFLFSIPGKNELHVMHKWDAGVALDEIERHKLTKLIGVPTMMRDILEHPAFSAERVASMKNVVAGGAPVPPSQLAQLRSKAKNVTGSQGYGLTETLGIGTVNRGLDYVRNPTSCGKPVPILVDLTIKDPDSGKIVSDGQRGEICIRAATNMKCYYNRPEDTKKAIDSDGFFRTGDIGKIENGFVFVLDRLKDLIIRGGENIDCSEVEAALCSHPAVRECVVFGLPDERLGEVVGAAIWATERVTTAELSAKAAETLAAYKVPLPRDIFIRGEELPKGATGKLDKRGLRDHYSKVSRPPMSKL